MENMDRIAEHPATAGAGRRRYRLATEFCALYLGLPLVMALALPADRLWPVMAGVTALAAVLLCLTPEFRWRTLARGWRAVDWLFVALVAGAAALVCGLLVMWLAPSRALELPRRAPDLWLAILAIYPFLSALPQELVFRVLYFRRYRGLFGSDVAALTVNAAIFALAHLMFWNWVAVGLSAVGALIFGYAYLFRGGFAAAVILHAVAGGIVFTSGLGRYFYHGAVTGF